MDIEGGGDRGLFRGSELPRLLILLGLMLVGIPMTLYYGYFRQAPPKPARVPIANLPKLPPPSKEPMFDDVRDKTPRTDDDTLALQILFRRVRDKPEVLTQEARREVLPFDLLTRPQRYRGLPIRLTGYARQVYANDDVSESLVPGGRIYEIWFNSEDHDQRMYPLCLWTESAPKTLPGGRDLDERILVEGYFLKLLAYKAGDTDRSAPLLIGQLRHTPVEAPVKARRSDLWTFLPIAALVVYFIFRFSFSVRKTLIRPSRRLDAPKDRIEPEELNRWLHEPEHDDDLTGS